MEKFFFTNSDVIFVVFILEMLLRQNNKNNGWLGYTSLLTLHKCPLLAKPLQWAELEKTSTLDLLECAVELI